MNSKIRSRVRGAVVGTAIGDALGMPAEGMKPSSIFRLYGHIRRFVDPMRESWASKAHTLKRGQWTDDTQLMLAIGESLVAKRRIDFADIARRHIVAMQEDPRGWGGSTISGFTRIKSGVAWWNSGKHDGAGNGTPMKIAPLGVLFGLGTVSRFEVVSAVMNISRMSHGDPRPAVAGMLQAGMIAEGIRRGPAALHYLGLGDLRREAGALESVFGAKEPSVQSMLLNAQRALSCRTGLAAVRAVAEVVGAGCFVVRSFPFVCGALCAMGNDPEECLIEIVNQGGDADTTGAMAGAVLGAAHGLSAFPRRWRSSLEGYDRLIRLADGLCDLEIAALSERPRISFSRKGAPAASPVANGGDSV